MKPTWLYEGMPLEREDYAHPICKKAANEAMTGGITCMVLGFAYSFFLDVSWTGSLAWLFLGTPLVACICWLGAYAKKLDEVKAQFLASDSMQVASTSRPST